MKVWELEEGKEYEVSNATSKYKIINGALYVKFSYSEDFSLSEITYNRVMEYNFTEYTPPIDWSKVEVNTKVLISGTVRRYFAKYKDGLVYTFKNGTDYWSSGSSDLKQWDEDKVKLYIES